MLMAKIEMRLYRNADTALNEGIWLCGCNYFFKSYPTKLQVKKSAEYVNSKTVLELL